MRYRTRFWMLSLVLWSAPPVQAASPTAAEFSAPLQSAPTATRSSAGASARPRLSKDAATGEAVLNAGTAQAAINLAAGQRSAGCQMIRFGNGFGWVGTGTAQYPASENSIALYRSRQDARFKAFLDADARLAGCLSKLGPEPRQRITTSLEQHDNLRLSLVNLAFTELEKREQAIRILGRGYIAYSVEENPEQRTIYVNLATTPKTAARLTRPAPNAMEAASLQEGLRQTQTEIAAGLVPPAGNRLIVVNGTGEVALVGYASNVVGAHPDPGAQDKLRADAEKIATRRATEALVGLVSGDDAGWQNGLDEITKSDIQMLYGGYAANEPSVARFTQIRNFALGNVSNDAGLEALREGRLPQAAAVKRFSYPNTVAVAISYAPPVKKRAVKPAPAPAKGASEPPRAPLVPPVKPAAPPANNPPLPPALIPASEAPPPSSAPLNPSGVAVSSPPAEPQSAPSPARSKPAENVAERAKTGETR